MKDLNPILIQCNDYQFTKGQRVHNPSVESRFFLWCKQGRGEVHLPGESYDVEMGDFFILPWRHNVEYRANKKSPFLLGGLHLIPWHRPDAEIKWGQTAHHNQHPLYAHPDRQDRHIDGLENLQKFKLPLHHPLLIFSEYLLSHFQARNYESTHHDQFIHLLLAESRSTINEDHHPSRIIKKMHDYILRHIEDPISVDDLSKLVGRSNSQIGRICHRHLNKSPGKWVNQCRIDHSCHLLGHRDISVQLVAERSGFKDPFHFSRLFKQIMGVPPLKYRKQQNVL